MRGGHYDGRNSLDLLRESADWVEDRIISAIMRAGFDPEERRSLGSFIPAPKLETFHDLGWDVTSLVLRAFGRGRSPLSTVKKMAATLNHRCDRSPTRRDWARID